MSERPCPKCAERMNIRSKQCGRCKGEPSHGNRWTPAAIEQRIRAFYADEGRAPTAEEWKRAGPWPDYKTVRRQCGSWANAVEAAGLTRPRRGIWVATSRYGRRGPYRKRTDTRSPLSLDAARGFKPGRAFTFHDLVRDENWDEWEDRLLDQIDGRCEIDAAAVGIKRRLARLLNLASQVNWEHRPYDSERGLRINPDELRAYSSHYYELLDEAAA